jgi:hypothetical protein
VLLVVVGEDLETNQHQMLHHLMLQDQVDLAVVVDGVLAQVHLEHRVKEIPEEMVMDLQLDHLSPQVEVVVLVEQVQEFLQELLLVEQVERVLLAFMLLDHQIP